MIPKDVDKEVGLFEVEKGLIFDLIGYIKKANVNNKIIFPWRPLPIASYWRVTIFCIKQRLP
jgi:hypothetical protein